MSESEEIQLRQIQSGEVCEAEWGRSKYEADFLRVFRLMEELNRVMVASCCIPLRILEQTDRNPSAARQEELGYQ